MVVFFIIKLGWIWLLQRVICQSFYDANHLSDWQDNQFLGVISKHDSSSAKDYTGKDRCHKLQSGLLLTQSLDADSGIGD
jgi:hypothetical protein